MADLPFTIDQLRILRAIASEGSFKKAADSLYVTASGEFADPKFGKAAGCVFI